MWPLHSFLLTENENIQTTQQMFIWSRSSIETLEKGFKNKFKFHNKDTKDTSKIKITIYSLA